MTIRWGIPLAEILLRTEPNIVGVLNIKAARSDVLGICNVQYSASSGERNRGTSGYAGYAEVVDLWIEV